MQCSRTFLFQMCLSLLASTGSCTCKPTDNNEVRGSEAGGGGASDDDGASARLQRRLEQDLAREEEEEEDAGSRLESLLGTMKEGFLRKLNLSDVPQESAKIQPPQFMMELYNKYASNSTAIPQSDVIRSFTVQDIAHSWRNGSRSGHRLLFNVSLPGHEKVTAAQLRLFLAHGGGGPRPDGSSCNNKKATVKVYEVDRRPRDDEAGLDGGEPHAAAAQLHLLEGKEVAGTSWEMFDVTRAVLSWSRRSGGGGLAPAADQQLEVVAAGGVAVSASVGGNGSAALIVFSDDLGSRRRETKKELKEMILHEEAAILYSGDRREAGGAAAAAGQLPNNELPEEEEEEEREALPLSPHHPRRRRRRRRKAEPREYCRRTSLKVNFKDIGWDSWIVAPPEYDAFECRGLCYHPLTDESTPSKHALIQTLVNVLNPRRANMACCVPIRLDPITVMYQENGRLTIRYLYEEMKVAECGCR